MLADVYDWRLRCEFVYKPGLSHASCGRLILDPKQAQFDPALLIAFRNCELSFQHIFEQNQD